MPPFPDKGRAAAPAAARAARAAAAAAAAEQGEASPPLLQSTSCRAEYSSLFPPWSAEMLPTAPPPPAPDPADAAVDTARHEVVSLLGGGLGHEQVIAAVEVSSLHASGADAESQPLLLRDPPPSYAAAHCLPLATLAPPTGLAAAVPPLGPPAPPTPTRTPTSRVNSNKWQPMLPAKDRPQKTNWCGILLAFMSGACFTLSSAAVKALRTIDPMELLVIRSLLQVLAMLPLVIWGRGQGQLLGPPGYRLLLQLQGFVGGMTLVLLFFSFRRLPLGDATTIIFSSPVLVMVLSFIFLREPCGFFRTFIVFLLVTGVVLIAKPPFIFKSGPDVYDVIGYTCAIFATIFTALNIVVMRKCKDVHFSVVVLQLSIWSLIMSAGTLLTLGHRHDIGVLIHRTWYEWLLAVAVSVLGLTGQVLVAKALNLEGAGKVSVTRSLDIVLAFILQVFAFGDYPDWESILGALMVLVCVVGIGLEEHVYYIAGILP
ncbi:solute carrier family 35 member G1-like isoform X1 [Schistocerca cancellata]|uniref:solute carrier family 35 member G1-like isoform X1 n=1 Tax=Schistocerca cancellata TaxID=274614 RepID=UPI002117F963|nr:solute carrier family 35 member G1-like isoform X1 [Schistocerca cancellata]